MHIKSVTIKNSHFFNDTSIDLSKGLNCLMGGRGSGKTSLISLIAWAVNKDADLPKETLNLVKSNLGAGSVEILVIFNGNIEIRVTKNWDNDPIFTNIAGDKVEQSTAEQIRKIIYFQAGQIERIGLDPKDRLNLFDKFLGTDFRDIQNEILVQVNRLKENQISIQNLSISKQKLTEDLVPFSNTEKELNEIKASIENTGEDQKLKDRFEEESKKQTARQKEKSFVAGVTSTNTKITESINSLKERIEKYESDLILKDLDDATTEYLTKYKEHLKMIVTNMGETVNSFNKIQNELASIQNRIDLNHQEAQGKFVELQNELSKNSAIFLKLNQLNQQNNKRTLILNDLTKVTAELDEKKNERNLLLTQLDELTEKRYSMRAQKADKINEQLDGQIKIVFKKDGLKDNFEEIIKSSMTDQSMKYTNTDAKLIELLTPRTFLSAHDPEILNTLVAAYDLNKARFSKILDSIREDNLFRLETCICEDFPEFLLKVDSIDGESSYRRTEELSTGQRCTTILPIVFLVAEQPLLIDQPEDNLDNKFITGHIHEIIRSIKSKRQLIFVTHNPNIPVLSDSEFNAFLKYEDKTTSVVAKGTTENVKEKIVELLEGGAEAFNKRKSFYGY